MKQIFVFLQFACITGLILNGGLIRIDIVFILQILGVILGISAIRGVGNNNWSVYPVPNPESSVSSSGPYGLVRHPMYLSLILFFVPIALRSNTLLSWVLVGTLMATLVFKIFYEEKKIIAKHPDYKDYMQTTKRRLIPFLW
jgi:protein-S-isoprenylcysteine O-methyltransferase Ste14